MYQRCIQIQTERDRYNVEEKYIKKYGVIKRKNQNQRTRERDRERKKRR